MLTTLKLGGKTTRPSNRQKIEFSFTGTNA